MRFLWISTRKHLAALRRDPISVLTWLGIPLCIGVLVHLVFSGGQATPQGRLLIADQDDTIASNLVSNQFSSGPMAKIFVVEKVSPEEGRARMARGDASAFLLIPHGMQDAFLRRQPSQLRMLTNPQQSIVPKIAVESLSMTVDGAFYLQHMTGDKLRDLAVGGPIDDAAVTTAALRIHHAAGDLRRYLDPPLIQLETSVVQEQKVNTDAAAFFFPTMIYMALMLMANGLAGDIWSERANGTLRRLATTPASLAGFLGGRLLTILLLYLGVALAGVAAARWLAGAQVANLPVATIWAAFSGMVFYLGMLLVALASSSRRAANVWGNGLLFPLSLVGGCFFPFAVMPQWLADIGKFTPNGWAVLRFQDILAGAAPARQLAVSGMALAAVIALAFVLALHRLRRGVTA
jgi:ABC-2 type transport system permease protein